MTIHSSAVQSNEQYSSSIDLDQHYHQVYTVQAGQYDCSRFGDRAGQMFNANEQALIQRLLDLQPGQTLLDVAAGTGRIAMHLAEQNLQVTALDLTRAMLQQARKRTDVAGLSGILFVEGNARTLPFADGQFDAVIAIRFLHLFPIKLYRPFIIEMLRVLRPGGVLVVEFNSALAGMGLPRIRALYRQLVHGGSSHHIWPHHIAQMFSGIDGISLHGFWPVGAHRVGRFWPGYLAMLERFIATGWRSFLANIVLVRVVKPNE